MNGTEIMKRDIACNKDKIKELQAEFKKREPAKETYQFMSKVNTDMAIFKEELRNLAEDNKEQHKEILKRISRLEVFVIGVLVVFALAALYFIFEQHGLPKP